MLQSALPSIGEILNSTEVISNRDASNTVVKVRENVAVKYGKHVTLLEAQNLRYLAANSKVPVPEVYGTLVEAESDRVFIIMELVQGERLQNLLPSLTTVDKQVITEKIRAAREELRSLPRPDYIGSLDHQPCFDGVFYTGKSQDPSISGPFSTEEEMNAGLLKNVARLVPVAYLNFMQQLVTETLRGHRTVFTHGDLQAKNILVRQKPSTGGLASDFDIRIIDWEFSGWYPEYWEFCNATVTARKRPEWLEMMQQALGTWSKEYLMMQSIRSILFY